ncbi:MAG: DNA repair protein RecN [Parasporobacterium sp.]|nr:DNA repair protein RecN [Parasporobacterium sp.]
MLKNVHLKNIALIKEADFDYEKGLNIMTGETGAGKSIIISSINIALGDKANRSIIRTGADYGLVELTFIAEDERPLQFLDSIDISRNDREITITRKITQEQSISKINGEKCSVSNIKELTGLLIDIHGQHDHQSLLNSANHINIVDSFGGRDIEILKEKVKSEYNHYKELRKESLTYDMDEETLKKEKALIEHELKEIDDAGLKEGEDSALEAEYKAIQANETVSGALSEALYFLNDEKSGAADAVSKSLGSVLSLDSSDEEIKNLKNLLMDLDSLAKDAVKDLSSYLNSHPYNAERLKELIDRLNVINHLKSRYGSTIEEIIKYSDSQKEKLSVYANYAENRDKIYAKLKESKSLLNQYAHELSDKRKEVASAMGPDIIAHLKELNFLSAEFAIDFKRQDKISDSGFDKVEFLISTNPGESLKPLSKVASGGELSRIMLAIKSAIAKNDDVPTMIFDEIDTGISGVTAQKVAEKLFNLSRSHQLICITHLPQIAAMGDIHFAISKEVADGSTISGIRKLTEDQQAMELAKLVGGVTITESALANARELKALADAFKQNQK